jgi:riboflavin biosynthesis pyrimidine reductase
MVVQPEEHSGGSPYGDLVLGGDDGTVLPWLALCMVASVDGAVTLAGRSGGLGGTADRRALSAIRDAADTILVGAGTVRAERYGSPPAPPERVARRRARGLTDRPRIVVVTRSGVLPPDLPLLSGDTASAPPVTLLCASADADGVRHALATDRSAGGVGLRVLAVGDRHIDWPAALLALAADGCTRISCEGGPRLNADLLAADVVDEVFVTLAPALVGGDGPRLLVGAAETRRPLELVALHRAGDELLLRYRTARGTARVAA